MADTAAIDPQINDPATLDVAPNLSDGQTPHRRPRRGGVLGFVWSMPIGVKLCALWLILLLVFAIFADWIPFVQDPNTGITTGNKPNTGPSTEHWLGTDNNRRDIFSRIVYGARVSLTVAAVAVAFGLVIGGMLGAIVGYYRGHLESLLMAATDVILAFPGLVLLLAIIAFRNSQDLFVIATTIGFLSIPPYTRVSRANTLAVSNREFVLAARALGTKRFRILLREIIPNVLPSLVAYALVAAAVVIVLEGSLAFLGLSVEQPTPTWGSSINDGRQNMKVVLWPVLFPALAMFLTVFSLNNIGDWLRKRNAVRAATI